MKRLILVLALGLASCASISSLFDPKEVQQDATQISVCEQVGRDCKANGGTDCYAKYQACTVDAGLRD